MKVCRDAFILGFMICVSTANLIAATPQCTLRQWTGVTGPAGKNFGPDSNEGLDPKYTLKLRIPRGRTAQFTFWMDPTSQPETAIVLYDDNFKPYDRVKIGLRGTNGGKGFAPATLRGPKTVIITGWHKDDQGKWAGDYSRAEGYPSVRNMWIAGVGSNYIDPKNGGYRDFAALINCY